MRKNMKNTGTNTDTNGSKTSGAQKGELSSVPKKECADKKCLFHGKINVKEESYTGKIIKKDVNRSATIEWERQYPIPKYERYEKRRSRLRVHNPTCIDAAVGDMVHVSRTRPLSKTKNFIITKIIEKTEKL
jgi:small subunit ribosomal protein S17